MGHRSSSRFSTGLLILLGLIAAWFGTAAPVAADPQGEDFTPDDNKRTQRRIEHKVESRPDGISIQISVRQTSPGYDAPPAQETSPPEARPAPAERSTERPATRSEAPRTRNWTDARGTHYEDPNGDRTTFRPPVISSTTRDAWMRDAADHPDRDPYLVSFNDEFAGLTWLPRSPTGGPPQIVFEPAPPDLMPTGGGSSTDPREVALDTLAHLPLPDIRLRMNPSLGLVGLPGWFWVDGYDGAPFGTSRSVNIPPAVGPEVPVSVVPAGDPRRQGTSFTVEVRVWPTRYDWAFGDGASLVSRTLGKPYPTESDVQHRYEFSSFGLKEGFPVRLTIQFAAEFRVNGGGAQGLPPIRRTYSAGYRVQEMQPLLSIR